MLPLSSGATQAPGYTYPVHQFAPHATALRWFGPVGGETVHVDGFIPPPSETAEAAAVARDILITQLPSLRLRQPILARMRFESGEWLVEAKHLPLYGSGDTYRDAVDMLQREIESLWDDLNADDAFSKSWLTVRRFLARIVIPE